jgi:hypothetical protein
MQTQIPLFYFRFVAAIVSQVFDQNQSLPQVAKGGEVMTQDQAIRRLVRELGISWDHAERMMSEAEESLQGEPNYSWSDCYARALQQFTPAEFSILRLLVGHAIANEDSGSDYAAELRTLLHKLSN